MTTGAENAIRIAALEPAQKSDFLGYFDTAFTDNPDWAFCYCHCFHFDHLTGRWADRTAAENRAASSALIESGLMHGYLARAGETVIGWCNAAPRRGFKALEADPDPHACEDITASVMCFHVSPAWRGRGVARALLEAACDGLRAQGMKYIEANPRPRAKTAADHHFGPLALYLSEGFTIDREDPDGSVWVRKAL